MQNEIEQSNITSINFVKGGFEFKLIGGIVYACVCVCVMAKVQVLLVPFFGICISFQC